MAGLINYVAYFKLFQPALYLCIPSISIVSSVSYSLFAQVSIRACKSYFVPEVSLISAIDNLLIHLPVWSDSCYKVIDHHGSEPLKLFSTRFAVKSLLFETLVLGWFLWAAWLQSSVSTRRAISVFKDCFAYLENPIEFLYNLVKFSFFVFLGV